MRSPLLPSIHRSLGLAYSFLIYYGLPFHQQALTQIYAPFIHPGDLCFDIGAHLGDRTRAFSRLGGRVVALEPHPGMMKWLRRWYGNRKNVTLVEQAIGNRPGRTDLWISHLTPTLSTTSPLWQTVVQQNRRFAGARWEEKIPVTITTLDTLIAQHGVPAFCKIDVEGAEREALQGLSHPLPALSFEYIPATIDIAIDCIYRLNDLGDYEYNWRVSEFPRLRSSTWLAPTGMIAHLQRTPPDSHSGDVYARLRPPSNN